MPGLLYTLAALDIGAATEVDYTAEHRREPVLTLRRATDG
jgi:hypothetical protein